MKIYDLSEWAHSLKNVVIRYLVYKKMFTPYEEEKKYMDESVYEDSYHTGCIREIIILPDNDVMLGIQPVYDFADKDSNDEGSSIEYYKLSELRIVKFASDQVEENWL